MLIRCFWRCLTQEWIKSTWDLSLRSEKVSAWAHWAVYRAEFKQRVVQCWQVVLTYRPSLHDCPTRYAFNSLSDTCYLKKQVIKKINLWTFGHVCEGQDLHTNCLWIPQIPSRFLISGKADVNPKGWTIQVLSEQFCVNLPWLIP